MTLDPARIIHALPTRLRAVVIEAAIARIQDHCRVLSLLRRVPLRICCRRAGPSSVAIRVQASLPLHGCDVSITSSRRCNDVAAPKGSFCATPNFTIESCISHCYVWGCRFFLFSRVWQAARANAVGRATQVPSPSRDATLPALSSFLRGFLKCCAYAQHQEGLMQIACGTQDRRAIKPLTRRSPVFCGFWRLRGEGHLPRRSTGAG